MSIVCQFMNVMFAGMIGGWEMFVILAVILMLFGARKLPELAKGLGQGIKEFKKATREVTDEVTNAMDDTTPPPQKRLPANNPAPVSTVQSAPVEPSQTVSQSSAGTKA
jgi:sec-independent protein translocase protein TatA